VILLGGCVNLSPWYPNSVAKPRDSIRSHEGYQLAFIEFREQGSYWDTRQVMNATELIRKTPKPLVITYVHGWHNDAGSPGVERFSGMLSAISRAPLVRDENIQVIGVYL